jgi:Domain of unknown function (DUF4864)
MGRAMRPAAAWPAALLALVLLALLLAGVPAARAATPGPAPADATAIRRVIEAQLAAFQRDDGGEAFSYAAPAIQQQFGTPERFMRMVREGYAPVYRPRQVIFEELVVQDGRWVQPLLVTAQDSRVLVALYTMERQPDGSWRIGGVVLLASRAQGA